MVNVKEGKGSIKSFLNITSIVAIFFSLFHLINVALKPFDVLQLRAIHLYFAVILGVLIYVHPKIFRISIILLATLTYGYVIYFGTELIYHLGFTSSFEIVFGVIAISILIYISWIKIAWVLPVIALVALGYTTFIGGLIPGLAGHGGYSITRTISLLYMSNEGVFGVPIGVSSRIVSIFVIFAAFIKLSGAGEAILHISMALAGGVRGGPGKIAVISSAFFGSMSGSAVANVAGTGSITIPLMKKTGFRSEFAAAVEAVASTGGQLMPPVMGAAAFIMSEVLGIPYLSIVVAAIVPSLLYYYAVFLMVDFEAAKTGLSGQPRSSLPDLWHTLLKEGHLLFSLVVLVYLLVGPKYSPGYAAFYSILVQIIMSFVKPVYGMNINKILEALETAGKMLIEVALACAVAGIVVGVLGMTGLGLKLSSLLIKLSGGSLFILLILTMLSAIILGMGLPTVAVYVVVAALIGPALIDFGLPPLAAHLFIFYYGILAVITPPVALASYAAAGIAGCSPNKAGWYAVKLGLAGFLLPYIFIYSPELLLKGDIVLIVIAIISALAGITLLACGISSYPIKSKVCQSFLILASVLMIIPGVMSDLAGIVLGSLAFYMPSLLAKFKLKNR